jgi:hypothetical protein
VRPWIDVSYADAAKPLVGLEFAVTAPLANGKPLPLFPKIDTRFGD